MRKRWLFACLATTVSVITAACGSTDGSSFANGPDGGGGDEGGGGDGGGGIDGGFTNTDGGRTSNGGDAGLNACAADTQQAKLAPLDLVMMQDTSGSMWEYTTGTTSKWDAVKSALGTFMSDPSSAGIGLGIAFFPVFQGGVPNSCTTDSECGASGGSCVHNACSKGGALCATAGAACGPGGGGTCTTLDRCHGEQEFYCLSNADCNTIYGNFSPCDRPIVRGTCSSETVSCTTSDYQTLSAPIAALPGSATAVNFALSGRIPNGLTPTYSALNGAIKAAQAYAASHASDVVAVVLSTDGIPNSGGGTGCDDNTTDIDNLAAAALAGTPSIKTFVIGVLSPADNTAAATSTLNGIAAAGGTTSATILGTSSTTESDFVAALTKIRGQSLPCQFDLPVPEAGTPDYSKVNVVYTDSATGNANLEAYVADFADCGSTGGWYYDHDPFVDAGTPTKVILCPSTCTAIQDDPAGKVDVVQGCAISTSGGGPPR